MAKAPWERPTAAQLADFAAKILNGDSPRPAWLASYDVPAEKTEEPEQNQESVEEPEAKEAPALVKGNMKQTVVASASPAAAPSNPKATVIKANVPVEDKSFSPWIWVGVSLAGLLIGFLLNYFV
jgi:hypothetical protein